MNKKDVVYKFLSDKDFIPKKQTGRAYACSNIALCKYWGKRNRQLNLPNTPSLSVSLGPLGTSTEISVGAEHDSVILNHKPLDSDHSFVKRMIEYLDLFRKHGTFFRITTRNTIPTSAGMASSASGFAALVKALNDLFEWQLTDMQLSILARLGSGSACRSIFHGFVYWHTGKLETGMDCYAEPIKESWPEFRLGILTLSSREKQISSRQAMKQTVDSSYLYRCWPDKVKKDMQLLFHAIRTKNFKILGRAAENNAITMHATMMSAWPPVLYWLPETVETMQKIWNLRKSGLELYFTIDAGPNIKLLFLEHNNETVKNIFKGVKIIAPFGGTPTKIPSQ